MTRAVTRFGVGIAVGSLRGVRPPEANFIPAPKAPTFAATHQRGPDASFP